MNVADRAKQAGTAVNDASYTLGAAIADHLTLFDAFQMPTNAQKAGTVSYNHVPLLIETASSWQIITATVSRNSSDVVTISNGIFRSSSTGSTLGLAVSTPVVITVVPSYWTTQQVAFGMRAPVDNADKHTNKVGGCDDGGLMALGARSFSDKAYAIAVGDGAYPRLPYEQAMGAAKWPGVGDGEALSSRNVMMVQTTNATATELASYDSNGLIATGYANSIAMWPGVCTITGVVTAYERATNDRKAWEVKYVIGTDSNYSTCAILGTPVKTELYEAAGATAWDFNPIITGTTLTFKVTGEAAHNISWVFSFDAHYHVEYP